MHMVKKSLNLISNLILVERERERGCLEHGYVGDWVANVDNLP